MRRSRALPSLAAVAAILIGGLAGLLASPAPAGATSPGPITANEPSLPSGSGAPEGFPYDGVAEPTIVCVSTSWCIEAVDEHTESGRYIPVTQIYSSGSWSTDELPVPANADLLNGAYALGVSCSAAGACVVVGYYADESDNSWPFTDTLSSGSWTAAEAPQPSGTGSYQDVALKAVSCPSATSCVAAGVYESSSGKNEPFIDTLASGSWTASALSLPSGVTTGGLTAISCASSSSCAATGSDTDSSSYTHGLVETLSASTWSDQNAALPSGAASSGTSSLRAVTCWASGSCVAVGNYATSTGHTYPLVTELTSGTWAGQTTGTVASSNSLTLEAVSCYSSSSCAAVGFYDDSSGYSNGLVETYAGSSWSGEAGTEPANAGTDAGLDRASVLYGVSCPASGSCVAAGYYRDSSGDNWGLVDTLSGASQSAAATAEPSNAGTDAASDQLAQLQAIACLSSSQCAATGYYATSDGATAGLLYVGWSSSWTDTQSSPAPSPNADPDSHVAAVSCPTSSSCVAVGSYFDSSSRQQGYLATLSGGSWQSVTAPEPSNAGTDADGVQNDTVSAVSCPAAGTCVAVGNYDNTSGDIEGFVDTLSGGTWTASAAPLPANASSQPGVSFSAIACQAAGTCVAVGHYEVSSLHYAPLIESLSAGTWTATAAPLPSNAASELSVSGQPTLLSLACASATSCVTTGDYLDSSNKTWGLIESGSGTTWTATEAPEPSNAAAESSQSASVVSVSCPASSSCVAVGTYVDSSGHTDGLIETLAGGSWTTSEAPEPSQDGGSSTDPLAVSCPTTSSCTAVGEFVDTSGAEWGLIETLASGNWSASEAVEPSNAGTDGAGQSASLTYVSCPAANWCVAAGGYQDADSQTWGYVQTGSGSSWTDNELPEPSNAYGDQPISTEVVYSLACASDGGCLVGGGDFDSAPTLEPWLVSVAPPAPSVSAISPAAGPGEGGATVTISGSWFFPGSSVSFGGVPSSSVTDASSSSLEAVSPAGKGTVDVQVTTDRGTSPAVVADEYDFGPGSPGTLGVAAPGELYFDVELNGYDQWASASASAYSSCSPGSGGSGTSCLGGSEPVLEVLDDTGSGDGWAVDAYLSGSSGLPSGSVLDFDGVGSATLGTTTDSSLYSFPFAAVTPSTVCDNESSCVLATPASNCAATSGCPVDPVQLSGAGQVDLYSAAAGSGEGDLCLASGTASAPDCAGTTPTVFFDLGVPASARLGSYATASIVLTLASGP